MKMPVLFVGHGSPENIILKNSYTESLEKLGKVLPRPKAILVISAHWLTNGTRVTCMTNPKTIYDFYGFPEELYRLSYPSPGSPAVAKSITEFIKSPKVDCDFSWGLDHASWAVLKHMCPKADIPVLEMSLDYSPFNGWHQPNLQSFYELAKQLSPLREREVLIIGSGNIVHNLRLVDMENIDGQPYDWAIQFDSRVKRDLLEGNHKDILNCESIDKAMSLSVPTLDHYLPMIMAAALQDKNDHLEFFHEGFQNRSVSMRGFRIG